MEKEEEQEKGEQEEKEITNFEKQVYLLRQCRRRHQCIHISLSPPLLFTPRSLSVFLFLSCKSRLRLLVAL
jgi:hypothetical protein